MASQSTTTTKRATQKTATKAAPPARKKTETSANGSKRAKPLREMPLEELSLRAYKMTYERLHGSKKKKK